MQISLKKVLVPCLIMAVFLMNCTGESPQKESSVEEARQNIETNDELVEKKVDRANILFFGNSLTAGYGLDEEQSFPSLIQARIDSLGLHYQITNAGLSGETTAGGINRIDWVLKQKVAVFVLELGANDMLRGFDLTATRKNLGAILDKVKTTYPEVHLIVAGMQAPPNLGAEYTQEFKQIYKDIAAEYDADLIPFLLDGVAGNPALNLQDGIHPNADGQHIVRENVWAVLKDVL